MPRYITVEDAIKVADCECGQFRGIFARIKERLEAMPTADVRENVHAHLNKVKMKSGEWWHTCSKCIATWGSEDGELDFNFCPNCGAPFDERSEDDTEIR